MLAAKSQLHLHNIWSRNIFPFSMEGCGLYLPLWQEDMQGATILSYDQYHHVATVDGATWGSQGRTFDGNDDIRVADHASLNPGTGDFSVGIWANVTSSADRRILLWKQETAASYAGYYMSFLITSGFLECGIDSATEANVEATDATDHVNTGFHLYFMTVDRDSATGLKSWVDTVNAATADPTAISGNLNNTEVLHLGEFRAESSTFRFVGTQGEVFFFKGKVLTQAEQLDIYQTTKWRYI